MDRYLSDDRLGRNPASADDETDVVERLKVAERIASDHDQVGRGAGLDRSAGQGEGDLLVREPGLAEQEQLTRVDPRRDRAVAQVGPVDHGSARIVEAPEVVQGGAEWRRILP